MGAARQGAKVIPLNTVRKDIPAALVTRGYRPQFHAGERNPCPGCGQAQWHVGRQSAECAFCGTALPIAESGKIL